MIDGKFAVYRMKKAGPAAQQKEKFLKKISEAYLGYFIQSESHIPFNLNPIGQSP